LTKFPQVVINPLSDFLFFNGKEEHGPGEPRMGEICQVIITSNTNYASPGKLNSKNLKK
jgi:hypothetical protein